MANGKALRLHRSDNVAVVLEDISRGGQAFLPGGGMMIQARQAIPFEHKIALAAMAAGDAVVKYGVTIGFATAAIAPGDWVHTHNVASYFMAQHREGVQ